MVFILWKRQGLLRHAAISSVKGGITPNLNKRELWFLWKRQGLLRHAVISSVKGGITPNLYEQELWFLCSVCHLLMLNICMKFQ